ncbi:MAG TPA: TonB-dependent receptor [Vitreimonas sp.]|uniref:TonB-dependent receptor plug domain-containing protein n=1 Tax=Vitreimonas sp. TaxID=3069702 RepID=UPI002D2B4EC1|nr:TonB-dependent receptor [Vitreimonas sp.]HYD89763.1 TonB-dependent receptor [Vitreimonas sp.]
MSNINLRLAAATLAGVASISGQAAADNVDRASFAELFNEPVTTSATGAPQRATEAPVNMTIITQDDIRASGATDIPGVLERLANVDVMRSFRGQTDVSIRGYNTQSSPRLLVLVNGRQVYLDHYGMTNWDAIPVQLGEILQIEVVSGPNTALFGFNAVSGVVNIITVDALRDDVDEASVSAGAPGYTSASGIWTTRLGEDLGVRLSVGGFDAESYEGDDIAVQTALAQDARDPMARNVALNAAYALSDKTRIEFETTWANSERTERYGEPMLSDYETNSFKVGLFSETALGMFNAQIYSNNLDLVMETAFAPLTIDNAITVASASLVAKPAPAHTVRVAGEYRVNEYDDGLGTTSYDVHALSGMWNWQVSPALALTTAARYDSLELQREGAAPANFPLTNDDYSTDFNEWSFNLGAVYKVSEQDSLRFSAARGIGSPSLLELGFQLPVPPPAPGMTVFYMGNPNLAPAVVYNVEFGWDHDIASINGRLRASAFWQRSEDLRALGVTSTVYSFVPMIIGSGGGNVGESEMHGLEFGLEGQSGRIHWDAQYSWRSIEDELASTAAATVPLDFEATSPEHVATAGVRWVGERFEVGADARYTSETTQFGVASAAFDTPAPVDAYVQVNARAAWQVNDAASVELSGRNLLDAETQTIGLNPLERSVVLTLRTSF